MSAAAAHRRRLFHAVAIVWFLLSLPSLSLGGSWGVPPSRSSGPQPRTAQPAVGMVPAEENGFAVYRFPTADGGELKITPYGPDTVRVQWHWVGVYEKDEPSLTQVPPPIHSMPRMIGESPSSYRVLTPGLRIEVSKKFPLRVDFYDRLTGTPICLDSSIQYSPDYDPRADESYNNVRMSGKFPSGYKVKNKKKAPEGTGYFGLGDWGGPINRRGHRVQFWPDDAWQWGALHSPKYTAFPIFYAVQPNPRSAPNVYAIFFNNPSRTVIDMAYSDPGVTSLEAADGQIDYFFFKGRKSEFADIIDRLTALIGRSALLPKWAYGYHSSKFSYTQSEISTVLQEFEEHSVPVSAVFLDVDYMNHGSQKARSMKYWKVIQLTWAKQFPSPRKMIAELLSKGIRTVAMVEPFLDRRDPKFATANRRGFFVRDIHGGTQMTGIWIGDSLAWLDFTNPEASAWWEAEVAEFCAKYGIRGIWNDLNETADVGQLRLDATYNLGGRFPDLHDSRRWHLNVKATHSIYSTRASYKALATAHPDSRPYVLSRGGFPGVQRWAAGWSGDNMPNEEHLSCNIRAGVSIGICGFSNYGHDVGGFSGEPSQELMERWFEWASVTPSMRNHGSKSFARREPTVYPEPTRSRLIASIRNRYYFLPHLYSLAYASTVNGRPMNEPVVSVFPHDTNTFSRSENDFMVGRDTLVAPVVALGDIYRDVYFPKAGLDWHCFWSDGSYASGSRRAVEAPVGRLPIFVRPLGVVPVAPQALSHPPNESPSEGDLHQDEIEFHVWPGVGENEYLFYDDDGITPLSMPSEQRMVLRVSVKSDGHATTVSGRLSHPPPPGKWRKRMSVVFRALDQPTVNVASTDRNDEVWTVLSPGTRKRRVEVPVDIVDDGFTVTLRKNPAPASDLLSGEPQETERNSSAPPAP